MNAYLGYLLHWNFWCFLAGKGSRNYECNDKIQHWYIFLFLWPERMGQQMGQHHKDIIIYIGEWRKMWERSQSGKHVACLGMGLMGTFSGPKSLAVQIFFNALWAGLTNPRDILDSFNENPLTVSTCSTLITASTDVQAFRLNPQHA